MLSRRQFLTHAALATGAVPAYDQTIRAMGLDFKALAEQHKRERDEALAVTFDWVKEQLQGLAGGGLQLVNEMDLGEAGFQMSLQSGYRRYIFSVGPHYLGCFMTNRYPWPGEDTCRGQTMAEGPLTMETWCHIVRDILKSEFDPVQLWQANFGYLNDPETKQKIREALANLQKSDWQTLPQSASFGPSSLERATPETQAAIRQAVAETLK